MRLFEKLLEIKQEKLISFHVPGHKNSHLYKKYFDKLDSILDIDLTEIPGTDDLHSPDGCIFESQEKASELYGTKKSYFLVNGSTCGIYAMITGTTVPGDKVIVSRDCHRAVFDSIQLGDLSAAYISPLLDEKSNLVLGLTPELVEESILKNPDAKALILTYPNYNGICCDLERIEKIVHSNNMLLLVDEAHGAHLMLSDKLPKSSIEFGADIVVHSSHKTLPVFTQASMLHINSERVSINKIENMLNLYQTSSPSYLLMTSLDIAMTIIEEDGKERMEHVIKYITDFYEKLKDTQYNFLSEEELEDKRFKLDITKMTLLGKSSNINPVFFEEDLRKNGIQLEFSNVNNALLVASICNEASDFYKLYKTMENADYKCYSGIDGILNEYKSNIALNIRAVFYSDKERVKIKKSEHLISGNYIIPYPPGVPILIPGEVITKRIIETIKDMIENNQKIVGISNKYTTFDDFCLEVVSK